MSPKHFALSFLSLLALAGVVLLFAPVSWFPSFYDVRYMGFAALVGPAVVFLLSKWLRVSTEDPRAEEKNRAVDLLQFWMSLVILVNALGDLGLYQLYRIGFEFDKVVHFSVALMTMVVVPRILILRFRIRTFQAYAITFGIAFVGSFVWELYELFMDWMWHTRLLGVNGLDVPRDTAWDIVYDMAGILTGLFFALRHGSKKKDFSAAIPTREL